MAIRRARDDDCAAIARLRRQTIRQVNARDYPGDVIRAWAAKETARTLRASAARCKRWVALDRGRIVGFCEHSLDGELSRIYVHKSFLGKGIGSRLLETAEASLRKLGCRQVRLESTVSARDFYAARGYRLVRKAAYGNDPKAPIYRMLKTLARRERKTAP
jgi:putative acetyltransferase